MSTCVQMSDAGCKTCFLNKRLNINEIISLTISVIKLTKLRKDNTFETSVKSLFQVCRVGNIQRPSGDIC